MNTNNLPKHLQTTYILLKNAFPGGIKKENYFATLYLLYNYMSDRNLAEVVSNITGKEIEIVLNDIYKAYQMSLDQQILSKTKNMLDVAGFEKWIEEE